MYEKCREENSPADGGYSMTTSLHLYSMYSNFHIAKTFLTEQGSGNCP